MRIIGQIEHPVLKITVFKMDNRITVKFENAYYEQSYKLGIDERVANLESVEHLVDAHFIDQVLSTFQQMHQIRLAGFARAFAEQKTESFEVII